MKGTLKPDISNHPIGDTLTYPLKLLKKDFRSTIKTTKKE